MAFAAGITGPDEEQDRRIANLETLMSEIAGIGSDALVSRLEHVDLELDTVRKEYGRKWRYRVRDWYRSQL